MEVYEEDWLDDNNDDSVLNNAALSIWYQKNLPVPNNRPVDYRRTQVLYFLQELYGMQNELKVDILRLRNYCCTLDKGQET